MYSVANTQDDNNVLKQVIFNIKHTISSTQFYYENSLMHKPTTVKSYML